MMESLQQESRIKDLVRSGKRRVSSDPIAVSPSARKLQTRDAISWSVCFAIVALLTGALLFYRIGVTISGITSPLFYFSLAGFLYFTWRSIQLLHSKGATVDKLNSTNLN